MEKLTGAGEMVIKGLKNFIYYVVDLVACLYWMILAHVRGLIGWYLRKRIERYKFQLKEIDLEMQQLSSRANSRTKKSA
ncbi:MAG: hypothetical protein HQK53_00865 [Oligoflexia bacterium]|nr:hypothetical protein [Oligoflexia bacterium]